MIDLDAATDHGVLVCNTSQYCLDEVSNHALGLLLMLNRQLLADADSVRSGGWYRTGALPPWRLNWATSRPGRPRQHRSPGRPQGARVRTRGDRVRSVPPGAAGAGGRHPARRARRPDAQQRLRERALPAQRLDAPPARPARAGAAASHRVPDQYRARADRRSASAARSALDASHRRRGPATCSRKSRCPSTTLCARWTTSSLTPHSASVSVESAMDCRRAADRARRDLPARRGTERPRQSRRPRSARRVGRALGE